MSLNERLPYPGLRAFTRNESDLFFGREGCVDAMVDRLAATHFLAVLGPSGSGKSSLVRTGLLDALKLGLQPGTGTRWQIADLHPGGQPMRELAGALLQANGGPPADTADIDVLTTFLRRGPRSLRNWASHGNVAAGTNLLVLVDQFEELFRYSDYAQREEADAFVELLLESTSVHGSAIQVVITMRSEYLGACSSIPGLAERVSSGLYLTPRMDREECREAIEGPASVLNFKIEPALVNGLLNDLASFSSSESEALDLAALLSHQADQLPLMQHVLNRLWLAARAEATDGNVLLRLSDYDRIGGLAGALDEHGAQVMTELGVSKALATQTVFRALVSGTSLATAVRRPCRMSELIELVESCGHSRDDAISVVEAFRSPGCNFLRTSAISISGQDVIVDISHESLIRQWSPLRQWLEKEVRDDLAWRRLISSEERHRRGEGGLLASIDLNSLTTWWESAKPTAPWAQRHGGSFREAAAFLAASRQAETDRLNAERRQQQSERRRFLAYIAGLSGALAIVALLGIQVYLGRKDAFQARNEAFQARNEAIRAKDDADRRRHRAEVAEGKANEEAKTTIQILNDISDLVHSDHYRDQIGVAELQSDVMKKLQAYQTEMSRAHSGMVQKESIVRDDFRRGVSLETTGNARAALAEFQKGYEDGRAAILTAAPRPSESLQADFLDDGYRYAWFRLDIGDDPIAAQVIQDMQNLVGHLNTSGDGARLLVARGRLEYIERRYWDTQRRRDLAKLHISRALGFADRALMLPHPDLNTLFFAFRSYSSGAWDVEGPERARRLTSACEFADRMFAMSPMDSRSITARAECLSQKSDDASAKGDLASATDELLAAVGLIRDALRLAPRDQHLLLRLADLEDTLGTIAGKQGNSDEQAKYRIGAQDSIVQALQGRTVFPSDTINLKAVYNNCSSWVEEAAKKNRTDHDKLTFYTDIAEALSPTLTAFPKVPMLASIEADASAHLGELLERGSNDIPKAEKYLTQAIRVFDDSQLLQSLTPFSENFAAYCVAYEQRARLYASSKRTALMIADIEKMKQRCQPILERYPWDYWLRVKFIDSDRFVGKTLFEQKRYRQALPYLEHASRWGTRESSLLLARLYREGLGVSRSAQKAQDLQRLAGKQSEESFTVEAKLRNSDRTTRVSIYIEDWPAEYPSNAFLDQARWLKEAREWTIPPVVIESMGKLHDLAREQNASFSKLAYAVLSRDNDKGANGKAMYEARVRYALDPGPPSLEGLRSAAEKWHDELVNADKKEQADALDTELVADAEQLVSEGDDPAAYRVAWQIKIDQAGHFRASAESVAKRNALNRSLELAEHLPANDLDDLFKRRRSYELLGTEAAEAGDHENARKWYTKSREVAVKRFSLEPSVPHFDTLRIASTELHDELVLVKQRNEASSVLKSLIDSAESLLARDPSDGALEEGSQVYRKVAREEIKAGDPERARQALIHSRELAEKITSDTPDSVYTRYQILDLIGDSFLEAKFAPEARAAYQQAATSLERYMDFANATPRRRSESDQGSIASLYGNLSWIESEAGNFAKATEAARQGLRLDSAVPYIEANLAHGLLFSGKLPEAKVHYLNVRKAKMNDRTMLDAIQEDFIILKNLGFTNPATDDLLNELKAQ